MKDVKFLEYELDMWYFGILKKGWEKFARQIKSNKTKIEVALAKQLSSFKVKEEMVKDAVFKLQLGEDPTAWSDEQLKKLATELRKKTKPIILACNKIDIPGAEENYKRLKEELKDQMVVACSGASELALREATKKEFIEYHPGTKEVKIKSNLNEEQKKALEFIQKNVLEKYGSTGIQETLDAAIFKFLKYIAVFPGGVSKLMDSQGRVLPDCFLIPEGSNVLDFANKIHTDLGKHLLYGIDVRTKMKLSKDHKLKHRDVIEIISAAK
jgi:ribosome-binding ATPase YchF (GTP1/OBG family)